jgi:hypothetical protein
MEIPSISYTDFKKIKPEQIQGMKSCEITFNGEYLFTLIVAPQKGGMSIYDNIKTQAEFLGARANSVGLTNPSELIGGK